MAITDVDTALSARIAGVRLRNQLPGETGDALSAVSEVHQGIPFQDVQHGQRHGGRQRVRDMCGEEEETSLVAGPVR
jgi:hypothetical protein